MRLNFSVTKFVANACGQQLPTYPFDSTKSFRQSAKCCCWI